MNGRSCSPKWPPLGGFVTAGWGHPALRLVPTHCRKQHGPWWRVLARGRRGGDAAGLNIVLKAML